MPNWNTYQNPNLGLLFYKHIYAEPSIIKKVTASEDGNSLALDIPNDEKPTPFDPFYKALCNYTAGGYTQIENPAATHRFDLFTRYPGLLTGSGYMHETKAAGDFKIGYFFDHTTGQPVLAGSSVKGALRSLFEADTDANGNSCTGSKSKEAVHFIAGKILQSPETKDAVIIQCIKRLSEMEVHELPGIVSSIFGDNDTPGSDIFFDAVLHIEKCRNRKIMGSDFITPHPNSLKNPKPLQFIKVLPDICFEFRFRLQDSGILSAAAKEILFKQILLTTGIGAKTNVGYGQFK